MQEEEKLGTTSSHITEWDTESNVGEVGRYCQKTVLPETSQLSVVIKLFDI